MRFLGMMLIWLGILALIGGLILSVYGGMQISPLLADVQESKNEIQGRIDTAKTVLADVDTIRQQANRLIEAYKRGEITNRDDPRIMAFFRNVEDLSYRSADLRQNVENEISEVEKIAAELENRAQQLAATIGLGVLLMVVSGWLTVFGLLMRKK